MTDREYKELSMHAALRIASWRAVHGNEADRSGQVDPVGGTPRDEVVQAIKDEDGPGCVLYRLEEAETSSHGDRAIEMLAQPNPLHAMLKRRSTD